MRTKSAFLVSILLISLIKISNFDKAFVILYEMAKQPLIAKTLGCCKFVLLSVFLKMCAR